MCSSAPFLSSILDKLFLLEPLAGPVFPVYPVFVRRVWTVPTHDMMVHLSVVRVQLQGGSHQRHALLPKRACSCKERNVP